MRVSEAEWRLDEAEPESRRETRDRLRIADAVDAFLEAVRWEHEGWRFADRQFVDLLAELLASAGRRGIAAGEVGADFREAHGLAAALWDRLWAVERDTRKDRKERNARPQAAHDKPVAFPWYKRGLARNHEHGLDSADWCSIAPDALDSVMDDYLDSGLDAPLFEWICVDACVCATILAFGEAMKRSAPLTLRNPTGLRPGYFRHAGNLERMNGPLPRRAVTGMAAAAAVWLAAPAALGAWLWTSGRQDGALVAVAAWWAILLALPSLGRRLGIGTAASEFAADRRRKLDLLERMHGAYRDVAWEAPPAVTHRSLEALGGEVHWNLRARSLLVKAERRDTVRWRGGRSRLDHALESRIRDAFERRRREGLAMPVPELDPDALAAASAKLWETKPK